jgi:hypothetical protein
MKIIFKNTYEKGEGEKPQFGFDNNQFHVEVVSDSDPTLDELLELFEGFILACGYRLPADHKIEVVPMDF